jgi:hypothetical protein
MGSLNSKLGYKLGLQMLMFCEMVIRGRWRWMLKAAVMMHRCGCCPFEQWVRLTAASWMSLDCRHKLPVRVFVCVWSSFGGLKVLLGIDLHIERQYKYCKMPYVPWTALSMVTHVRLQNKKNVMLSKCISLTQLGLKISKITGLIKRRIHRRIFTVMTPFLRCKWGSLGGCASGSSNWSNSW